MCLDGFYDKVDWLCRKTNDSIEQPVIKSQ